jgi:hypothetical protein
MRSGFLGMEVASVLASHLVPGSVRADAFENKVKDHALMIRFLLIIERGMMNREAAKTDLPSIRGQR